MGELRILFVCLGNICRSPMAEGIFRNLVEQEGCSDRYVIDSAGTGGWHVGHPPDERARGVLLGKGIDISGQQARKFYSNDFSDFDLIVAMDRSNYENILRVPGKEGGADVRMLLSYLPNCNEEDVPDPYYGGVDGFEHVYNLVKDACEQLFQDLEKAD